MITKEEQEQTAKARAEKMARVSKRQPLPKIKGKWAVEHNGERFIKDSYGQTWDLVMAENTGDWLKDEECEIVAKLRGDQKIPMDIQDANLDKEGDGNWLYWEWYNCEDRPQETQGYIFLRTGDGPIGTMVIMINYQLYITDIWEKAFDEKDKLRHQMGIADPEETTPESYNLRGKTEEAARKRLETWKANQEKEAA